MVFILSAKNEKQAKKKRKTYPFIIIIVSGDNKNHIFHKLKTDGEKKIGMEKRK